MAELSKDEILNKIIEFEQSIKEAEEEYKNISVSQSNIEQVAKDMERAYKEIKARWDDAQLEIHQRKTEKNAIASSNKAKRYELESLRRELSRTLDAERIEEEYQAKLEEMRLRCLDAPWREENRTDGLGAYEYQVDGAIHMSVAGSGLLADKRGLGKSLTSLIWADYSRSLRTIFITPSDTMDNYIREMKLWTNREPIKIGKMPKNQRDFVLGTLKSMPSFNIILNYEAWRKDSELIPQLINLQADTLVLDEAHRGKTLKTATADGIQQLRFGTNQCPQCENPRVYRDSKDPNEAKCHNCGFEGFVLDFCSIKNVLPMTGTPILNKPQELFPNLRLIDPENFTREKDFLFDFCYRDYEGKWHFNGGAEKKIVDIIGPRYLARDRKSAGVTVPPATPELHILEWEEMEASYPAQAKAYRQARDYAQLVLDQELGKTMSMTVFLTVLLRLRQVLVWPNGITLKGKDEEGNDVEYGRLNVYESIKLDKAEELIKEIVEEGERVVLFSQFKEPLKELEYRLRWGSINSCRYDGDTSDSMKTAIELDFDPKTVGPKHRWDVVLGNYKSMGEGLNLNAASQMIILDEEWNPGRQEQAYGRIDRLGQTRDTTIHTIRVEKTVDNWMAGLIEMKRDMISGFESAASVMQNMYDALRNGEM